MLRGMLFLLCAVCCTVSLADNTDACVRVSAGNSVGSGTFFFLDDSGNYYVLTNHHVAGEEGSRVGVEMWTQGQLQKRVPGVVVLDAIDRGYTDVAVVKVAKESLGEYTPPIVPLQIPGARVGTEQVVTSRGCPGGTWATLFCGRTFRADEQKMEFYMRPGGGRSGSAIIQDEKIVGLLTWSSGKPGHESHGVDGYGYQSGYGIAQQIDTIWRVLRGNVSADNSVRPEAYEPLVCLKYQDADFSLTPEEQDALLKRLRDREKGGDGQSILPNERQAPIRNMLARLFRLVVIVGVVVLVAVVVYFVRGLKVAGVFLLCCIPMTAVAQDSTAQPELQRLSEMWNQETVSAVERWGSYQKAYDAVMKSDTPKAIVVVVTIPNCPACETLKKQLREADKFGWLNDSETAIVDATQQPQLAEALCMGADTAFPRLVVMVPIAEEGKSRVRIVVRTGSFPDNEQDAMAVRETADDQDGEAEPPDTVERFLAGCGVR